MDVLESAVRTIIEYRKFQDWNAFLCDSVWSFGHNFGGRIPTVIQVSPRARMCILKSTPPHILGFLVRPDVSGAFQWHGVTVKVSPHMRDNLAILMYEGHPVDLYSVKVPEYLLK